MNKTRISVLMAAYNSGPYIRETLDALRAQTLTGWECIVTDDGSTDDTAAIVGDYAAIDGRITLRRQTNQGCGMARNTGLEIASGDYICALDSDDLIPPDYFERAVAHLDTHPDTLVWVARKEDFGTINGLSSMRWKGYAAQLRENQLYASAIHRRSDALRIGGWRLKEGYEDWDYWLRLLYGHPDTAVHTDTEVSPFRYRRRGDSLLAQERPHDLRYRRDIRRKNEDIYDCYRSYGLSSRLVKNDIIKVVIPYLAEGAQGNELRWACEGWRTYFRELAAIIIVGDEPPKGCDYDQWIPCPRISPVEGQYMPHLDIVHKFRAVRREYPHDNGFIYACDDMYAVNDFGLEDVLVPKLNQAQMCYQPGSANGWQQDEAKTRDWLTAHGLPTRGWICHLPVYYEWDRWVEVVDMLGADTESYVVEEVYFNYFYNTRPAIDLSGDNPYRCRIERANFDATRLQSLMSTRTWVSNSVEGYTPALERILNEHYGII